MDKQEIEQEITKLEKTKVGATRNVRSDLVASVHMIRAYEATQPWTCICVDCEYTRAEPRIAEALERAIKKNFNSPLAQME